VTSLTLQAAAAHTARMRQCECARAARARRDWQGGIGWFRQGYALWARKRYSRAQRPSVSWSWRERDGSAERVNAPSLGVRHDVLPVVGVRLGGQRGRPSRHCHMTLLVREPSVHSNGEQDSRERHGERATRSQMSRTPADAAWVAPVSAEHSLSTARRRRTQISALQRALRFMCVSVQPV